jgi:hypothetical protein
MATDDIEQKVKVLLHEHSAIRGEILAFVGYYMNHVRNFQLVIFGLAAAFAFGILNWCEIEPSIRNYWFFWFLAVSFLPVVSGYLASDIIYAAYMMAILGSRNRSIERQIREMVGPDLMVWETKYMKIFVKKLSTKGVPNPGTLQMGLVGIMMIYLLALIPLGGYYLIWNQSGRLHDWILPVGMLIVSSILVISVMFAKKSLWDAHTVIDGIADDETNLIVEQSR